MAKEKTKAKKIIIPVVAVLLAAALLVTGYFVWFRPEHGKINEYGGGSDTKKSVDLAQGEISYETADYKGYKVPEPFVEILEQAEKDSEADCEKYGVAMKVGDKKISETEFAMAYFDLFIFAADSEIDDPKGLAPELTAAPADQPYGNKEDGITWSDRLREETEKALRKRYILFYDALENGFMLPDDIAADLGDTRENVEYSAKMNGSDPDAMLEESYCEGATVCLYARSLIIRNYAEEYEKALKATFAAAHSDSEIKGIYEKNPKKYNYVDARILQIYADDADGAARAKKEVKNTETLFSFGADYYKDVDPYFMESADKVTRYHFALYDRLSQEFGSEVADWCFADERKEGDVEVLPGGEFDCVIYIEKPTYSPESVDFRESLTLFNDAGTAANSDDESEAAKASAQKQYDLLERNKGSEETMIEIAGIYNESYKSADTYGERKGVYIYELGYNAARWMTSSDRKKGDYAVIETGAGWGLFMFEGVNKGDIDALSLIRHNLAEREYREYYESLLNFNGNRVVTDGSVIGSAAKKGESSCARFAEKRLQRIKDAQEAQTQAQ